MMWLRTYDGKRVECSARHPEQLAVLAPQPLLDACRRIGGVSLTGKANFRLALVSSRFMIAGGHEFLFLDAHGNYQKTCPAEMFLPRYPASPPEWGLYVLERWHPPQWYYEHGFGRDTVEWNDEGKAIQSLEPIWSDGGYEACLWDATQLFVFPRDVSADGSGLSLQMAIHAVFGRETVTKEMLRRSMQDEEEKREKKEFDTGVDIHMDKGRAMLFEEPAVSMTEIKEELWQKSELCASEPAKG